jgi:predicted DNA-binding protein
MRQARQFVIQLGVKVAPDQDTRLTALARREGCTVSALIRQAIEKHLNHAEQPAPAPTPARRRLARSA